MSPKKRAAIYTRISKDLAQEGLGVARQLADCRRYAEAKGLSIVAEFEDNDISASGLKARPSYQELKRLMESRGVDTVLVYAMDRLHRNMGELIEYIALSNSTSVGIESITGGRVDLSTADGRLQAHIFGAVAAAEREKAQERVKRKHLELAQNGKWPGRRVFGYLESGEVVEEEAEIIRELATRVLNGEPLNDISRNLEERGIGTIKATVWRASTISAILKSSRIAGHRSHHGVIVFKDAWPAIIDQQTHALLRARFAPGQSFARGGPRKYLLTGLLRCGQCHGRMTRGLSGAQRIPNYRCPKNQATPFCGRISIKLEPTEAFITEALFAAHDRPTEDGPEDDGVTIAEWTEARDAVEGRKKMLAAALAEGHMSLEEFIAAKASIEKQLAALPAPEVRPKRQRITGDELRAAWPDMPMAMKHSLLDDTFNKITVMPRATNLGRKFFNPERLVPDWRV